MIIKNVVGAAVAASAILGFAAPANAVSFANFVTLSGASNIYWQNSILTGSPNGATYNSGKSGTINTVSAPGNTTAGLTKVKFNFLIGGLPQLVDADFSFFGSVTNTPAYTAGICPPSGPAPACFLIQDGLSGTFAFTAKAVSGGSQTIGAYTIPDGTVLLAATNYTGSIITGVKGGRSASLTGSDPAGGPISFFSDAMFGLDFTNTNIRDFSITLGSIANPAGNPNVGYNAKAGAALSNFYASANGTFGSEPSPSVPEPATWALFIAGFGMVGFQVRRRRQMASVVS
jgi:hypothetical protein